MAEKITAAQLLAQRNEGDEFEIHDNGQRSIAGFEALVAELRSLVEAQRANAGADMLRSESQSELISLLHKIVSKPAGGIDMSPMIALLTDMQTLNEARPRAAYEFSINRDNQGFMQTITATPVAPTIN